MPNIDNTGNAPVIPAGTEPNVFGTNKFSQDNGQANAVPTQGKKQVIQTSQTNSQNASQDTAEAETTFEGLATKKGFKSVDDLAKSYTELETKLGKKESIDQAELLQAKIQAQQDFEGKTQKQMTQQLQEVNPDMPQDEAVKIVQGMIDKAISPLKEKLAIQDTFKNPEDMKFASDVAKIVRNNPNVPWDVALDAVKQRQMSKETIKAEGRNEAYQTIQQKQSGQSDIVQTGTKNQPNLEQIINDKNMPFSEIQKIMKERFSQ